MSELKYIIQVIICVLIMGISSCKKEVNYTPQGTRTPLGQYVGFTTSAYTILKISGDSQSDTINSQLNLPLKVQIQDSLGVAYSGEQVTFVVTNGGGSLSSTTVVTDVNGYAETFWVLGSIVGTQSVSASANVVNGSPIIFTAIGRSNAATAYTLLKISGDNQNSMANSQLTQPLKIQVQDSLGGAYFGEQVTFGVTSGGGNLSSTTVVTDVNGYAEVYWTLGSIVGAQSVSVAANVFNGSPLTFTAIATPSTSTMTDSRDGNVYATIIIGNQTWMAENLRYNAPGSFLNPGNPSIAYGRLYSWATVMNGLASSSTNPSGVQGICPSGWHVPSDPEWNEMELVLGMFGAGTTATGYRGIHGVGMKSVSGWNSGGNGINSSGFNALPAGFSYLASYNNLGNNTYFWSSTEYSISTMAWSRELGGGATGMGRFSNDKTSRVSCRCVKD